MRRLLMLVTTAASLGCSSASAQIGGFPTSPGPSMATRRKLIPLSVRLFGVIARGPVEPVLPARREDIDVDGILGEDELVRNVGRDDHDVPRLHDVLASLRIDFGRA